jgi:hypothetical protein
MWISRDKWDQRTRDLSELRDDVARYRQDRYTLSETLDREREAARSAKQAHLPFRIYRAALRVDVFASGQGVDVDAQCIRVLVFENGQQKSVAEWPRSLGFIRGDVVLSEVDMLRRNLREWLAS